jgi:hypothetical protein
MGTEVLDNRDNFNTVPRSLIILLTLLPQLALAHGVSIDASVSGEAIVGTASYADGSPLVDASVTLSHVGSSANDKILGQGRTNDEGRFAFPSPRHEGEFLITADDGIGHRGTVSVMVAARVVSTDTVRPNLPAAPTPTAIDPKSPSSWTRWVSGLGYLIGLFGLASWWLTRRGATRSRD